VIRLWKHNLVLCFHMWSDDLPNMSDESLVQQFLDTGQMVFFEEIWKRYRSKIHNKCKGLLVNRADAEDATSDTCLNAMKALRRGQFRNENLPGWLRTIAKNACLNIIHRANRSEPIEFDLVEIEKEDSSPDASVVEKILNKLSEKQRITLKLFYIEEMSYEEIAAHQGWTVGAVKSYAQNGRRMFEKYWQQEKASQRENEHRRPPVR
jgi:RNA polymerase sigma-70 factor, ECF subfamily